MAVGQIKLRIFPDGRVEAEIAGIAGSACMKLIPLVEELVGGETIDSQRTPNYFLENTATTEIPGVKAIPIKGER